MHFKVQPKLISWSKQIGILFMHFFYHPSNGAQEEDTWLNTKQTVNAPRSWWRDPLEINPFALCCHTLPTTTSLQTFGKVLCDYTNSANEFPKVSRLFSTLAVFPQFLFPHFPSSFIIGLIMMKMKACGWVSVLSLSSPQGALTSHRFPLFIVGRTECSTNNSD